MDSLIEESVAEESDIDQDKSVDQSKGKTGGTMPDMLASGTN